MIIEAAALLAFSEDIKKRSFLDWLEAHTSFMNPLHTCKGFIKINGDVFLFSGTERKTGNEYKLSLFRHEIQQLYHGFDNVFTIFETRNFGIGWKPLRITFTKDDAISQIYLIVNYSLGRTDNAIWMEILKNWVRG